MAFLTKLDLYADRIVDLLIGPQPDRADRQSAEQLARRSARETRLGLTGDGLGAPSGIGARLRRVLGLRRRSVLERAIPRNRAARVATAGLAATAAAVGYGIAKLLPGSPPAQPYDPRVREGVASHEAGSAHAVAAAERERGREATSPFSIPWAGWKDIFWRVYREFGADRILAVAAGVTFYTLLALFPAIAALVSSYGLFAEVSTINDHLAGLGTILPAGALDIVSEQVKRIAAKGDTTLGFTFALGLGLSLWSANAGMKAIIDALNLVYEEEEARSFVKLNLQSLAFTLGALAFVILALGGIVVLPVVFNLFGLGDGAWLLALLRWPALLAVVILGLCVIYRYGPSRTRARWPWVVIGAAVAGTVWLVASILFSWYVSNFGSYNETYGSLGAAVGFMTWIWLSATIVLLGAEINAEIEHQTLHDTTVKGGVPLGTRGARMADTLGESYGAGKQAA